MRSYDLGFGARGENRKQNDQTLFVREWRDRVDPESVPVVIVAARERQAQRLVCRDHAERTAAILFVPHLDRCHSLWRRRRVNATGASSTNFFFHQRVVSDYLIGIWMV